MNQAVRPQTIGASACPHDCPSTCALEIEVFDKHTIGRVRGAAENAYTAGVICAKVARYAERVHHPDRLLHPLRRIGPKGSGEFEPISWDDALDLVAEHFIGAEQPHGSEAIWPYYYAGTMGLVMRDGINRLRHAKKYSGFYSTICINMAWTGYIAGTGKLAGADPREMAKSDCVVIWGTNAVNTQVNVMTHATRARKKRGAKIVVVDVYMKRHHEAGRPAGCCIRPGTDGALACAVMHVLVPRRPRGLATTSNATPTPGRARSAPADPRPAMGVRASPDVPVEEIEAFARLVGDDQARPISASATASPARATAPSTCTRRPAFRGHRRLAATKAAAPFTTTATIFHWQQDPDRRRRCVDPNVRMLDQSRIGPVLTGDPEALQGGPPVTALLIQNTNPVTVAPEQEAGEAAASRATTCSCACTSSS